jgi:hypothetical protein
MLNHDAVMIKHFCLGEEKERDENPARGFDKTAGAVLDA